jgi:NAD(P)-dependent dehydrogenase (short-subunit alcohol dehydrogenase family)
MKKVAIVTGASREIGRAVAKRLVHHGCCELYEQRSGKLKKSWQRHLDMVV